MRPHLLLPPSLRRMVRINQRALNDLISGHSFRFSKQKSTEQEFPYSVSLVQEIKKTNSFENKRHNIQTGVNAINGIIISSNELFSFWKIIRQPSAQNGYKISRNLINGTLREDYGGGLCQLSGIIYHLSLIAGLQITERHPHSIDIYEEHERFCPLGADATVVYGYKDLRVQNPFSFPVKISLKIIGNQLECAFYAPHPLMPREVIFERTDHGNKRVVETIIQSNNQAIQLPTSIYHLPK